jgi:hypothetical protein
MVAVLSIEPMKPIPRPGNRLCGPRERVAVMLGHRSVKVAGKYYSAWSRTRQKQLEADVRRTWSDAPMGA